MGVNAVMPLKLFKDQIKKTPAKYTASIRKLSAALDDKDPTALKKLLCATVCPEKYRGNYQLGNHNQCLPFTDGKNLLEKRLCKCLYYFNNSYPKNCAQCTFSDRFKIVGDYQIVDYEVPAYYGGEKSIGEIDLILRQGSVDYATEVKPYHKNNREPLLRMAAEILTYTLGYPPGKYQKAIAFFEKNRDDGTATAQQLEYQAGSPLLFDLFKKAGITVFRLEEAGPDAYRICKLPFTAGPAK